MAEAGVCPHCGSPLPLTGDAFCSSCSGPLDDEPGLDTGGEQLPRSESGPPRGDLSLPPGPIFANEIARISRRLRAVGWVMIIWAGLVSGFGLVFARLQL